MNRFILLAAVSLLTNAGHADLLITRAAHGREVIIEHCDAHSPPVCTDVDRISERQFRDIASQVSRMTLRRLMTMAATLKAMPYISPPIAGEYGTFRRISQRLDFLTAASPGGTLRVPEADPGAEDIIEVFDRAIAARAANPKL